MPAASTDSFYFPFQPNWDDVSHWRREVSRDPHRVRLALEGYKQVLTDEAIFAHNWIRHPLVLEYRLLANRWRMLETGLVLRALAYLGSYRKWLLSPMTYLQAVAELRVALLFQRMGFRLVHEPSNVRKRETKQDTKGPDWLAVGTDRRSFGVEVKCPRESDKQVARTKLVVHLAQQSQVLLGDIGIDMSLDSDAVENCVNGRWINRQLADEILLESLVALESDSMGATPLGRASFAPPGYSSMFGPVPEEQHHEIARLRDLLQGAALQLRDWSPGVVVLDTSRDRTLMRRCCGISSLLTESWARHLGCVLLMADTCPGFVLTVVRGPQFGSLPPFRGWQCTAGHFHVRSFGGRLACELDRIFDPLPAFCCGGGNHRP